jgi:deazaflavin-dependent oxidoreductase (nitroreductase family)
VASKGGHPEHPGWYANLMADPHVMIQDGPEPRDYVVREVEGDERQQWWERSVAVFPTYEEYAARAGRTIPVLVATPV